MITMRIRVSTLARGYSTMYPPSTPAIAPEAPTVGTVEFGPTSVCSRIAATPPSR